RNLGPERSICSIRARYSFVSETAVNLPDDIALCICAVVISSNSNGGTRAASDEVLRSIAQPEPAAASVLLIPASCRNFLRFMGFLAGELFTGAFCAMK